MMYPSAGFGRQQRQQERKFQILTERNAAGGPLRVAEARYKEEGGRGREEQRSGGKKRREEEEKVMGELFFFFFLSLFLPFPL